jgi:hypothetical protein
MSEAAPDRAAAELAAIREYAEAATKGPWWHDEDELMWRLHGVHAVIPAWPDGLIGEQVMNHQILKAPKSGTPYAEYWPSEADGAFITRSRSDLPRLLAVVEKVLAAHHDSGGRCSWCRNPDGQRALWPCGEHLTITRELLAEGDGHETD